MSTTVAFDAAVVGAGAFGLYAAGILAARGSRVVVIDQSDEPFARASTVNQARLHNGYHYPRSLYTALTSVRHFQRFVEEFPDAVNDRFDQVYAVASRGSYTDVRGFEAFCRRLGVRHERVDPARWFRSGMVDGAFLTEEFGFDAAALRDGLLARLPEDRVSWRLGSPLVGVVERGSVHELLLGDGSHVAARRTINATYAGVNAVLQHFALEPLPTKYELAEVVLVEPSAQMDRLGITVMDGPFFSLMPFGHGPYHSLTSVAHTPRRTSRGRLPTFPCQEAREGCGPQGLADCSHCPVRPSSGFAHMARVAGAFLRDGLEFAYADSLWTVKTVLSSAEVDDGRPTIVREDHRGSSVTTVLSGKINSMFDLEAAL